MSELTVIDAMNGMGQDAACAEVLRTEIRRMEDRYYERERKYTADWKALRTAHTDLRDRLARAEAIMREISDNEDRYLYLDDSDIERCIFCHAPNESDVDDGNPHEDECWIVRADALLATPTEGDARAWDAAGD